MKISDVNGKVKAELKSRSSDTKLKLIIHGWEFPKIRKGEDSKWLFLSIRFKSPIYSAFIKREPGVKINEISDIYDSLKNLLEESKESIKFKLSEPYLDISIKLLKKDEFMIKGLINDIDTNSGSLKFEFESDNKCLKKFLMDLKKVIDKYKR